MIAAIHHLPGRAFHRSQGPIQQGCSGWTGMPLYTVEPIIYRPGKAIGGLTLILFEDAQTEVRSAEKPLQNGRPVIDTDQNQRRLKRDRGERIDR